ncbi:uncharacterized protein LOC141567811 [Rhinolophus sinicus]|uniref:uncharacterized protein LOC141567811 n=1 Tax=Rhinolophus sinicus TaxID=89399 RepID=UPI003D7ACA29
METHAIRGPQILVLTAVLLGCSSEGPIPFERDENIWVYLAKHVLNISDFCLSGGTYVEQTFTSCLIGVCTPLETIRNHTMFQSIDKRISYSDIYHWGPVVTREDRAMFSLKVSAVTPVEDCVMFTGCTHSCFVLTADADLNCSSTTSVSYANGHVKLPAGWFLICGRTVYSYVPANSTGGPCSLGRLTVFLPQRPHPTEHHTEIVLSSDCNSEQHLFSPAEYTALSLVVMPAMTIALNIEISSMACSMVKALNATSQAIHALGEELGQVREAVLENRAAIDYLLLRYNHGCEEFKGLCCFNLTDNSHLIEGKVKQIHDLISNIKQKEESFGLNLSRLISWLPNLAGLRETFFIFLLFVIVGLMTCCCIHCTPTYRSAASCLPKARWTPEAPGFRQCHRDQFHLKLVS